MADRKFSELTSAGTLAGTEIVALSSGGSSVRTTTQDIANLAPVSTTLTFLDTGGDHSVTIKSAENNTANRDLEINLGNATRRLTLSGDATLVAGTAATLTGAETLTNKTLTAPAINTCVLSGGTIDNAAIGGSTPAAGAFTTLSASGMLTASTGIKGTVQALTGPGAVNITTLTTTVVTTGADALTLADGAIGQLKFIVMLTDGGDGTLTPANFGNGTTITFNDIGDSVLLQFLGTEWWVISNNGCTVA
jgi:hypothetical protein